MDYYKLMRSHLPYAVSWVKLPNNLQDRARKLCWAYNVTVPDDGAQLNLIKHKLLEPYNKNEDQIGFLQPFHCGWGFNLRFHGKAFFNEGCTIQDSSPVDIGDGVMAGPHVCISCTSHSLAVSQRKRGLITSYPISIGDWVLIGADVTILGGVKIGAHAIIGAGSVVTRNIPANVVAYGVPCKARRKITKKDLIKHHF